MVDAKGLEQTSVGSESAPRVLRSPIWWALRSDKQFPAPAGNDSGVHRARRSTVAGGRGNSDKDREIDR